MSILGTKVKEHALIAHHADCIDGFTSAYITEAMLYKKKPSIISTSLPMGYDEISIEILLSYLEGKLFSKLYVVDFSLDVEVLKKIHLKHPSLQVVIIDHHKTAFEKYLPEHKVNESSKGHVDLHGANIHLDITKSGAGMCWEYFNGPLSKEEVPALVKYIQDYDLWKFIYGDDTRYIHHYLCTQAKTMANWSSIQKEMETTEGLTDMLYIGKKIKEQLDEEIKELALGAVGILILEEFKGLALPCKDKKLVSDLGHVLAVKSGTYGAVITYCSDKEREVTINLRSNGDYDVSHIAKKFGGGGHKNAAGFIMNRKDYRAALDKGDFMYGSDSEKEI